MTSPLPDDIRVTERQHIWEDQYLPGVPLRLPPNTQSLVDMLDSSVGKYAALPAVEFFGQITTYAQFDDQISRVAEGLRRMGVSKGDRVAVLLPNCPQSLVAFYAILRLGAVVVEHNPLYQENELAHPFYDHGAKLAIAWDKIAPMMQKLRRTSALENIISVNLTEAMPWTMRLALRLPISKARETRDKLTSPAPQTIQWSSLLKQPPISVDHARPVFTDPALVLYTSGTTGTPKGAVLTHANLVSICRMGAAWIPKLRFGEEVVLGVLPMFHAYGVIFCCAFAVYIGAKNVLIPSPDIDLIMKIMHKEIPTFIPAVPPLYAKIVTEAEQRGVSILGIRHSFSGAMSLPPALVERWENATDGLLIEGYGLTEASPIVAGNPMSKDHRPGTVGVPFPETEIRIANPENLDEDQPLGEEGELLVRGPQIFAGYYNLPEKTAETMHKGWLRTGDIAVMGEDGFITIVDRIKEIIITGGFNVYPSEVEEALREHPSIVDASVVAWKHSDDSETVVAGVVLEHGAHLDKTALIDHSRKRLARYKVPREYLEFSELPTNATGKVLRKDVAEEITKRLAE